MHSSSTSHKRRRPTQRSGKAPLVARVVSASDLYEVFSDAARSLRPWEELSATEVTRWEAVAESLRG